MSALDLGIYLRVLAIVGIVAVLWLLHLLLAREWVKTDIIDRGFTPVSIRWKPFAWWLACGPVFRVTYSDTTGAIHHAECGLPNGFKPVRWRKH
ncbi:MAG TPA: hypothetical protein VN048_13390 [Verrucomicrobiae bacterium]|jgi:hypothetical protein|nr:hypothetical protein [Verrucomicrobiae bacterium]